MCEDYGDCCDDFVPCGCASGRMSDDDLNPNVPRGVEVLPRRAERQSSARVSSRGEMHVGVPRKKTRESRERETIA